MRCESVPWKAEYPEYLPMSAWGDPNQTPKFVGEEVVGATSRASVIAYVLFNESIRHMLK